MSSTDLCDRQEHAGCPAYVSVTEMEVNWCGCLCHLNLHVGEQRLRLTNAALFGRTAGVRSIAPVGGAAWVGRGAAIPTPLEADSGSDPLEVS